MDSKYAIARPINGITINGREYVCDEQDKVMLFESEQSARDFLKEHGIENPEDEGIDILEWEEE